jgi:hypothetical protein
MPIAPSCISPEAGGEKKEGESRNGARRKKKLPRRARSAKRIIVASFRANWRYCRLDPESRKIENLDAHVRGHDGRTGA